MPVDWGTWAPVIAAGAGTALSAYMANKKANDDRAAQADATRSGQLLTEEQSLRNTALQESNLDPFRQQMNQAHDLTALDVIARSRNTPVSIQAPGKYAKYMPQISGGFSYDMSPDNREAAKRLQRSVAAGETAPTMTNPANYGKTSALNLVNPGQPTGYAGAGSTSSGNTSPGGAGAVSRAPGAGSSPSTGLSSPYGSAGSNPNDLSSSVFGAEPGSAGYSTNPDDIAMNATSTNAPFYQNYRRRREGAGGAGAGALKGLQYGSVGGPIGMGVGAAAGAIAGAFTKNAESAMSDFYVDDARGIVKQASQQYLGRMPTDQEVDDAITGQGWKGGKWVGQEGVDYIIQQIRNSPEAQQRAQQNARGPQQSLTPSYNGLFAA